MQIQILLKDTLIVVQKDNYKNKEKKISLKWLMKMLYLRNSDNLKQFITIIRCKQATKIW